MEQRHTIEYFHNQGLRPCQIFNQLKKFGMKRDMVYRTVKRLNETGSVADRTGSGRPASSDEKNGRLCESPNHQKSGSEPEKAS